MLVEREKNIKEFQKKVRVFYKAHGRHALPWRKTKDPYKILVSEMMLQQTQVDRVVPKYKAFLKKFPTMQVLAKASLADVLREWSGLGYNRRALFLKRAAEAVVKDHKGKFPSDVESLESLPGIGLYTSRAVATFAYNEPHAFIETNIRAVFIHSFFPRSKSVSDAKLMPLIEQALDRKNAREWEWALMDYGSHIKKTVPNPSRKSKHHVKQPAFEGSLRQVRGAMLRELGKGLIAEKALLDAYPGIHAKTALDGLLRDGFIVIDSKRRVSIK